MGSNFTEKQQQGTTTSVILPLALREELLALAQCHERSLGAEMRVALREHVASNKSKPSGS